MQLKQFYNLMSKSRDLKKEIVTEYLKGHTISEYVPKLNIIYEQLKTLPRHGKSYKILSGSTEMRVDLSYELTELEKDIYFLKNGEEKFIQYLAKKQSWLERESEKTAKALRTTFNCFITDRDGTINNYCGRYMSSVQSVYNAVILSKFVDEFVDHAIIITSAPLEGVISLSVNPDKTFIYAGSKGREYQPETGMKKTHKISRKENAILENVQNKLETLLKQKKFEQFGFIGSGFQKKFGQITMARQDIAKSIPKNESENFLKKIKNIVAEVDPNEKYLAIEDTGLDVEIILTKGDKAFNKGDGVEHVSQSMKLHLDEKTNLVCGDTSSDISLAEKMIEKNSDTKVIFVTTDASLKKNVKKIAKNAIFVSSPDTLIATFYKLVHS
jgi:hypothetical protein